MTDHFPIQGRILGRFTPYQQRAESAHRLARALVESGEPAVTSSTRMSARSTAAGDPRRLRGLPAIGYSVAGVSPGTDPVSELMRKQP